MSNQVFIRADEIAEELGVSKAYAYKLMQMLNDELKVKRVYDHFRQSQS